MESGTITAESLVEGLRLDNVLSDIQKRKHSMFLLEFLKHPPSASLEPSNALILYFLINGIYVLGAEAIFDKESSNITKKGLIDYLYSLQSYNDEGQNPSTPEEIFAGFKGSLLLGFPFHCSNLALKRSSENRHDQGNLVYTFSAIASLVVLGDDLSRVRKPQLTNYMRNLQGASGGFSSEKYSLEVDLRFCYSACATSYLIRDWSGIDKERITDFVLQCWNQSEGAFGLYPNCEAHGGATYTALATLKLIGKLEAIPNKSKLVFWLVSRILYLGKSHKGLPFGGFQGRVGKFPDSCYSFWIGASLKILGLYEDLVDSEAIIDFVLQCQSESFGGFKKYPDSYSPDPIHTTHALYGLSLMRKFSLEEVDPVLGICSKILKQAGYN